MERSAVDGVFPRTHTHTHITRTTRATSVLLAIRHNPEVVKGKFLQNGSFLGEQTTSLISRSRVSLLYLQDDIIWPTAMLFISDESLFYSLCQSRG